MTAEKPKAIVSNRIYLKPKNHEHLKQLIDSLTYRIETRAGQKGKTKKIETIKNYKILPRDIVSIPQGRLDLVPPEYEIVDKRVTHEVPFPNPRFQLRDSQQPVYDQVEDTCFINALVGWGKTFTALHLARKFGQKTLVITHNTFLRDQWIGEVQSLYGLTPGIVGSGEFDIEDHFIVIGNIQTVIKHIAVLSKEFGTIILDEAHHVPAETFGQLIDGMYSRYRIALSGTMERTDGKHVVFRDYFGDKIYRPPQSHTLNPTVKIVNTGLHLKNDGTWVEKINDLLYNEDYQNFVAAMAAIQISHGHSVLIVADRTEFLEKVRNKIGKETCALVTGSTTYEQRKQIIEELESETKMCVAGSRQIFSEGISINRLSCVILAVPTSNPISLEQIIGRVMRLHPNKPEPLVLDIAFASIPEKRQAALRLGFYMDKGWTVERL
jgi:superfamily II DNA or RNA helicase